MRPSLHLRRLYTVVGHVEGGARTGPAEHCSHLTINLGVDGEWGKSMIFSRLSDTRQYHFKCH